MDQLSHSEPARHNGFSGDHTHNPQPVGSGSGTTTHESGEPAQPNLKTGKVSTFVFDGLIDFRFCTDEGGKPWFRAADVCTALGLADHRSSCRRIPAKEKGVLVLPSLGGEQATLFISEPGLFRLIFTSNKPEAERFTTWVVEEVLPAIRRTGMYVPEVDAHNNKEKCLWEAYFRAKTGAAQLAVLGLLGAPMPGQHGPRTTRHASQTPPRGKLSHEEIFAGIQAALTTHQPVDRWLAVYGDQLRLHSQRLAEVLGVELSSLRASLSDSPGYQHLPQARHRFERGGNPTAVIIFSLAGLPQPLLSALQAFN
jgi:prophage antirepressor-like protein